MALAWPEAGAAAVQAVVDSTEEKVRAGVEAAAGSEASVRDAKEAAEQAAQRIADATRDAAQRLKAAGQDAIESVRARTDTEGDEAGQAPVEERAPAGPAGSGTPR